MRRLGFLLAGCAACTVPSLLELERGSPGACDQDHPCQATYDCVAGRCRANGSGDCAQGQSQSCGLNTGLCRPGSQTCGTDGKWGACVGGVAPAGEVCDGLDNDCDGARDEGVAGAACALTVGVCATARQRCLDGGFEAVCTAETYGADYQVAETRCDGKDNDCDGLVDEQLTRDCANQQGVCASSTSACVGGQFPVCTWLGVAGYEAFERSCDRLDNDCDGNTDVWPAQNLSNSPAVVSQKPAAAALPGGGALVLWEEGTRIAARAVSADGTLGAQVTPADSITGASRAFLPAVAVDGAAIAAAWAEEVGGSPRLMVAILDSTGRSTTLAPGSDGGLQPGGAMPVALPSGVSVTAIALAIDLAAQRLFLAVTFDTSTGAIGQLDLHAFPLVLPAAPLWSRGACFGAAATRKIALAPTRDGGLLLAAEQPAAGNFRRCKLDGAGTLACLGATLVATEPSVAATYPSGRFVYLAPGTAYQQTCADFSADGGSCAAAGALLSRPGLDQLRVAFLDGGVRLASWRESSQLRLASIPWDGGFTSVSASARGEAVPLLLGGSLPAVVFAGDPTAGAIADEVVISRSCAP